MFHSTSASLPQTTSKSWRVDASQTALLILDMQPKLLAAMPNGSELENRVRILAQASSLLKIPTYLTEQRPEKLGHTIDSIRSITGKSSVWSKVRFSAGEFGKDIKESTILLCGMEAHICIRQTAYDLRQQNKNVVILADAISSRHTRDEEIALHEMQHDQFLITSVEALLFELMEHADHPEFKEISALIR